MSAAGVVVRTSRFHREGRGSIPTAALHSIEVRPIPFVAAKRLFETHHYLHSLPGGTKLTYGVFEGSRLLGAISLGAGPTNAYSLVHGASPDDCMVLTRLWLSDRLPRNSESRVIAVVVRAIRKHTSVKFLVSYADPSRGHAGTIYQAAGWLYSGLSQPMALLDLGDGVSRQSRSVGHNFGSHSVRHLLRNGVSVRLVPQSPKHRYVYFLDSSWRERLKPAVLPYPKANKTERKPHGGRVRGRGGSEYYGFSPCTLLV